MDCLSTWLQISRNNSSRCSACLSHQDREGISHCVPPSGPVNARAVAIGEAPGAKERNRPFMGQAGIELDRRYLVLAGLTRDEVYVTNVLKCRPPNNREPNQREIDSCSQHFLAKELSFTDPTILVLMGGTACKLVEGERVDLETEHGRWSRRVVFGREYDVFTVYHPALGMHSPAKQRDIESDFSMLGDWLADRYTVPTDQCLGQEEYLWFEDWDGWMEWGRPVFIDTESEYGGLYSWQLTQRPGFGVMARLQLLSDNRDKHERFHFFQQVVRRCPNLVFQNAMADVPALRREGIWIEWDKVLDTMQQSYRRGWPQGLKPLANRYTGMKMQAYMDVTSTPGKRVVKRWCLSALSALPKIVSSRGLGAKGKPLKDKVANNPMEKVLDRFLRSMGDNRDYDPWKAWSRHKLGHTDDEEARWREWVVGREEVGDMPQRGLRHCDPLVARRYACRDSDATCRVFERQLIGLEDEWRVREQDWSRR